MPYETYYLNRDFGKLPAGKQFYKLPDRKTTPPGWYRMSMRECGCGNWVNIPSGFLELSRRGIDSVK